MHLAKQKATTSIFVIMFWISSASGLFAQIDDSAIEALIQRLDSIITTTMATQNIPGTAYILVDKDKTLIKKDFGFSKIGDDKTSVVPDSTIFRIGSVSKTFTAAALLHLAEKGNIDLDKDVNHYLKKVQVPSTFSEPVTARHLLTHSAGFDEIGGRVVFDPDAIIPLDEFLPGNLLRLRKPGVVTSYSSYAIAVAGLLVEDISGQSLEEYLKENFWKPLEMDRTSIIIPQELRTHTAIGYELENGENVPQPWEWYHTYPASEINSTVADMGNYMHMLLNKGQFKGRNILKENTATSMTRQQLSTHDAVDGFAFGFYQRTRFGIESFCHGGDMLGFSGFLSLLPEKGLGLYIISHHEGGSLRMRVNDALMEFLGEETEESPEKYSKKLDLHKFAGNYRWMTYCHSCGNNYRPQSREITVNADNTLSGFGRKFYPIGPLLFKSFDGQRTMGFIEDEKGAITYMSLGNINTFEKIE